MNVSLPEHSEIMVTRGVAEPHSIAEIRVMPPMLYDWVAQAKRDSKGTGDLPAVFHKKNYAEVLVTMPLDDWMQLYREWEAGQELEEGEKDVGCQMD